MAEIEEEIFRKRKQKVPTSPISPTKLAKKTHSGSEEDERPRFKSDNKDGEEKYEQIIYSISASSGKFSFMQTHGHHHLICQFGFLNGNFLHFEFPHPTSNFSVRFTKPREKDSI